MVASVAPCWGSPSPGRCSISSISAPTGPLPKAQPLRLLSRHPSINRLGHAQLLGVPDQVDLGRLHPCRGSISADSRCTASAMIRACMVVNMLPT